MLSAPLGPAGRACDRSAVGHVREPLLREDLHDSLSVAEADSSKSCITDVITHVAVSRCDVIDVIWRGPRRDPSSSTSMPPILMEPQTAPKASGQAYPAFGALSSAFTWTPRATPACLL